jgi:hypothetical protein
MLKSRGGAGRYQPVKRTVCDRCHGQKLRCERDDHSDSCKRCRKAGAMCLVAPFVRVRRPPVTEHRGGSTRETQTWNTRTGSEDLSYSSRTPEEDIGSSIYLSNEAILWSTAGSDRNTYAEHVDQSIGLENLLFSPNITAGSDFGQLSDNNWERRQYRRDEADSGNSFSPIRQNVVVPSVSRSASIQLDTPPGSMTSENLNQTGDEATIGQPRDDVDNEFEIHQLSKLQNALYSSSTLSSRNSETGITNPIPVGVLHGYTVALIDMIKSVTSSARRPVRRNTPSYDLVNFDGSTDTRREPHGNYQMIINPSIVFLILGCYTRLLSLFERSVTYADGTLALMVQAVGNKDQEQNSIDLVQTMSSIEYLTVRINNAILSMKPENPSISEISAGGKNVGSRGAADVVQDVVQVSIETISAQKIRLNDMLHRVSKSLREGPVV